ncbi:hypothetical protein [Novipirellula artificiosorum]|nr:hypothetical protein [Novipirellula artificiosorum]
MSESKSNPYQPPSTVDDSRYSSGVWKAIGRVCVLIYGVLFGLFCIAGTIDDIWSREPIIETVFWIAMSVLTTYGVFALAIRRWRMPKLDTFWRYFAVALPFLTYLGAAWEIYHQPALPPIEFFAVLVMFVIVTTPGLVFNWMVRHRMNVPNHGMRSPGTPLTDPASEG